MSAMTQNRAIIITTARVDAYFASALRLLAWLFGVMLRLPRAGRSVCLKRILSRAERTVEGVLFLRAVTFYGPLPRRRRHPHSTPRGFRRNLGNRRAFMKSVRIRAKKANAFTRVMALLDALAHPQSAVAYFLKQICAGLRGSRLVAVAPPAHALESRALLAACASCDSS